MSTSLTAPRIKTVKRLFGVCGNNCAFPGCDSPIIDDSGTVVGEICHICAQNPDGPRYDSTQDDEARHGFENLLLLCGSHHKCIDDDPTKFTVKALVDMKLAHEKRSVATVTAPDELLQALIDKLPPARIYNVQAGANSIIADGNVSVAISGITYDDARKIALDVYNSNALELRGIAEAVAASRAEKISREFLEKLASEAVPPTPLSNPDVQYALFSAQKSAVRSGDTDLMSLLTDLLVDRVKAENTDLLRLVLNEAIEVGARLTPDQFDALSVVFLVRYTKSTGLRSRELFAKHLSDVVCPLLATASKTQARFQHLQYCGCGAVGPTAAEFGNIMAINYPHLFSGELSRPDVIAVLGGDEHTLDSLMGSVFFMGDADGTVCALPLFEDEYTPLMKRAGVGPGEIAAFNQYFRERADRGFRHIVPSDIHPRLPELLSFWREHGSFFTLTSVGIAIGHANLRRRGLGNHELSIWIN